MLKFLFLIAILTFPPLTHLSNAQQKNNSALSLRNDRYEIRIIETNKLAITRLDGNVRRVIKPALLLQYSETNPGLTANRLYNNLMSGWQGTSDTNSEGTFKQDGVGKKDEAVETDLFKVGQIQTVEARGVKSVTGKKIIFAFEQPSQGDLSLQVILPEGEGAPIFEMSFTPQKEGWYSLGFYGVPSRAVAEIAYNYLPLNWTWKHFPDQSYLVPESFCLQAATFVNNGDYTEGIAAHPSEIPYRYASSWNGREDSRFGLALRDRDGKARPMLFAPVFGGPESHMKPGRAYAFKAHYVLQKGDWYAGLNHVLYDLFDYRIERQNATVSLNETLENMIDFAIGPYGGWMEEYKGNDYRQDGLGTVKNVSALHPLGVALVTGNMEIFRKRALPMIEYMMSREKFLFNYDTPAKEPASFPPAQRPRRGNR